MTPARPLPRVLIVGGGFGGLTLAQALADTPVRITLVDRSNHHLFQPLLYQVAMAGLSPAEIAMPIRAILRDQQNVEVLLAEVTAVDLAGHTVSLGARDRLHYDFLVLAAGARTFWFGHDEWAQHALGLKDLDDALEIRRRVLLAFESAERIADDRERRRLLTFVVIGGGPTGVELAGALAELSRHVLASDFRRIEPSRARVLLLEAGPRILPSFPEALSASARRQLEELGVEVRTGAGVTAIDAQGVLLGEERVASACVIWGAGVRASPLAEKLGLPLDRGGRVLVRPDCSLPDHPEAFAIGDLAGMLDPAGKPLPGVSPVAMQQARLVAENIRRALAKLGPNTFRYTDKGTMATIGRSRAVAMMGAIQLSGFVAWLSWLFVHIWYLIGFKNRLVVLMTWCWSYLTYKRGARLITGRVDSGALLEAHVEPGKEGLRRPADGGERAPV